MGNQGSGILGRGIGGGIFIADVQVGLDEFTLAHVAGNTASTSHPNIYGEFDIIADPTPAPGDFNHDGTVDAADYVVWRKGLGTIYSQDDYEVFDASNVLSISN
jgi:hypothetical protein